jgi:RNA-directed DNA polymerase
MKDKSNFTSSAKDLSAKRKSAKRDEERQVKEASSTDDSLTVRLMEKIVEPSNLNRAYKRVKANKGAAGVDGMTVDKMSAFIARHKEEVIQSLLNGNYRPKPVKEVEIPKPGKTEETRKLGIPCVIDRVIQQAIVQVIQPIYEREFSDSSYGFRPGRSAHQAVKRAQGYVQSGHRIVVDIDLEKFFDRVNHDRLMSTLAKRIKDKALLKIIRAFLNAGIMKQGVCVERTEGVPQGGNLSPLLSNIVLDELDKELERRGHKFCRYADDCNVYVKSLGAGKRVMESLKQFLEKRLRLRLNEAKSGVAKVVERQFLGFRLLQDGRISISKKSEQRVKETIRQLTKRNRGRSLEATIWELNEKLRGWINYFKIIDTLSKFDRIDQWLRRKIRCYRLKQRKRSCSIARYLIELGVNERSAWNTAKSGKGWWRLSKSPALQAAMPNAWMDKMGLINLGRQARLVKA